MEMWVIAISVAAVSVTMILTTVVGLLYSLKWMKYIMKED